MRFYKETNFKETPIGKIPKDWKITALGEIARIRRGASPRPKGDPKYFGGNIPWIKISDLSKYQRGFYLIKTDDTVTEDGKKKSVYLRDGSLIISNSGTIGRPAIIKTKVGGCIHDGFISVETMKNADKYFLFYFFDFKKDEFQSRAQKGTQGNMNTNLWRSVKILLPPVEEQLRIVEVLSCVDLAIQKVDEAIARAERLKKGLMQHLLTKGIGHKEYKETPIGKIPKDWRVVRLENVAEIRGNKRINNIEKIAFIPMELISESKIFADYQIRTKEEVKSFTYCEPGDILLAKITPSLENGKQGIVPYDLPNKTALATTEVFPIHCKKVNTLFLFYIFKFSKFRSKIIASMTGTTGRQRATKRSVLKLEIPLPSPLEQQKIAEILSSVDKILQLKREKREKLVRMKRRLMDLLLTGRVRVIV